MNVRKLLSNLLFCIFFIEPCFAEQAPESDAWQNVSLYGYIANYTAAVLNSDAENEEDNATFGNALHLRLKGDWQPEETLKFHLELSYFYRSGNQNAFVQSESLGTSNIDQNAEPQEDFTQEFLLDHAWGLVNIGQFDLQFGKLPVAWGPGYKFNPTNRLNAENPLEEVNEETPGFVGCLGSYSLPHDLAVIAYLSFSDKSRKKQAILEDLELDSYPFGLKLQSYVKGYDLAFSFIKEVLYTGETFEKTYYAGGDFVGMIGDWIGIYGEGTLRLPWDGSKFDFSDYTIEENLDLVLGLEYIFDSGMELKAEYFHQGTGASRKTDYAINDLLLDRRSVLAEDYLVAFIEEPFWDFYKVTIGGIMNLNDRSYAVSAELEYDLKNNFQIMAGLNWLAGSGSSEFNGEFRLPTDEVKDLSDPLIYVKLKLSF